MSIFQRFIKIGTVVKVPDGKRVNMVQVEFHHNRRADPLPFDLEWINPKAFPEVPEVGQRIRFEIEPLIMDTEVIS